MRNENLFERDNSSPATISPIIFEKAGRPTNSRGRPKTDHPNLCESLVLPTAKYRCISIYSPLPLSLFLFHSHSRPSRSTRSIGFCALVFAHSRRLSLRRDTGLLMNEEVSFAPGNQERGNRGEFSNLRLRPEAKRTPPLLSALDNELPALQTTAPSK